MTFFSHRALYRSADETVTLSVFKKDEYLYQGSEKMLTELEEWCIKNAIGGTDRTQSHFPEKLKRFSGFPEVIYRKGNLGLLDSSLLAIVGPRKPSVYISEVMQTMLESLCHYRVITISGGAEGVDMMVHAGSLERGIPTIVILGAGFRWYQTRQERQFFENVVQQGGLLLSERKLDQGPTTYTFPQRNRIIAGCADAVFIPGAAQGSGSLITVDFALKFGIPVGSVPGSIFEITSAGTNQYCADRKIKMWSSVDNFLKEYFVSKDMKNEQTIILTDHERTIVSLLQNGPMHISLLTQTVGLTFGDTVIHLSCLEIKGIIRCTQPEWYGLIS